MTRQCADAPRRTAERRASRPNWTPSAERHQSELNPPARRVRCERSSRVARCVAALLVLTAALTFTPFTPPAHAQQGPLWSATMTVGEQFSNSGFFTQSLTVYGSLSPDSFTFNGQTYQVSQIRYGSQLDQLSLALSPGLPPESTYVLRVAHRSFTLGTPNSEGHYVFANANISWSAGQTVSVSLFEGSIHTSIAPVKASILAGENAEFRVFATVPVPQARRVRLQILGRRASSTTLSNTTVMIPGGRTEAVHTVSTTREDVGSITAQILSVDHNPVTATPGNEAVVEVREVSEKPTIRIEAAASIPEGNAVVFTVKADAAPLSDLPVKLEISTQGDYGARGQVVWPTIPAGQTSVTHAVSTTDDSVDEPYGQITGRVFCISSATCTPDFANDMVRVEIRDNDGGDGPVLRVNVEGASFGSLVKITEGEAARFVVTVDPSSAYVNLSNSGGMNARFTVEGGD